MTFTAFPFLVLCIGYINCTIECKTYTRNTISSISSNIPLVIIVYSRVRVEVMAMVVVVVEVMAGLWWWREWVYNGGVQVRLPFFLRSYGQANVT
ncbi:hypothetical protein HanIR_Chr04g0151151 [Helianthus annuus]|nr:hypothetical protein HanIR_Chr04g0151151 [Helianthus annuus]